MEPTAKIANVDHAGAVAVTIRRWANHVVFPVDRAVVQVKRKQLAFLRTNEDSPAHDCR